MAVKDGLPATDFSRMNREYIRNVAEGETVKDGLPATDFSRMNREYIKAVVEEAGGGGGGITVEELNVTENDTYTAPEGKAYSPVIVNVGGAVAPFPFGTINFVNNRAVAVGESNAGISGVFDLLYCDNVGVFVNSGDAGFFAKTIQPGASVQAYFVYNGASPSFEIDNNVNVVITDAVNFTVTPDEYYTTYNITSTSENFTLTVTFN